MLALMLVLVADPGFAADDGCLTCHEGIESLSEDPDHPHNNLSCVLCHDGDDDATELQAAHEGLRPNPSALEHLDETCGLCHKQFAAAAPRSIMSTMAGVISGARYLWGAQDTKKSLYGVKAVKGPKDGEGLKQLDLIPTWQESDNPVDDYLRKECLRCHLWDEGAQRAGDYRSSGCAACHVLYDNDGLSRSGDASIPKDEPGHPIAHRITSKIDARQCQTCHNRGARVGTSFMGMMEQDPYGTPWTAEGEKHPQLHGKNYNYLKPDVHYEMGMMCIDCHTSMDLHGDGNVYSKKEEHVETRCTMCHGTVDEPSELVTARGREISNVERRGDEVVLTSKYDGAEHLVTQLSVLNDAGELNVAMQIPAHMENMECYACHARWTSQCYGCHLKFDERGSQHDWVKGEETQGQWKESRSYLRWETPILGVNGRGKVSPFMPGCQVLLTQLGPNGESVAANKVFETVTGMSGIAHQPTQPHTIRKEARSCEDCHANPKAVGLGTGLYDPKANGLPIDFEWERIVDEDGNQLQATSHEGARPLNKEQLDRVQRIGACVGCHQENGSGFWTGIKEKGYSAPDTEAHMDAINDLIHGKKR